MPNKYKAFLPNYKDLPNLLLASFKDKKEALLEYKANSSINLEGCYIGWDGAIILA